MNVVLNSESPISKWSDWFEGGHVIGGTGKIAQIFVAGSCSLYLYLTFIPFREMGTREIAIQPKHRIAVLSSFVFVRRQIIWNNLLPQGKRRSGASGLKVCASRFESVGANHLRSFCGAQNVGQSRAYCLLGLFFSMMAFGI